VDSKALITGITGQDGYYLANLLLGKGYEVHGTIRRSSSINTSRIDGLISKFQNKGLLKLHYADLTDSSSISTLVSEIMPDEVYNLGAQSHVAVSFKNPILSTQVGNIGTLSLLEAIKSSDKQIKFYQASSSEMYGGGSKKSLNEDSIFDPKSPYAASKMFSHHITKVYRESYDLFASNGILFNHESPHRGETFVTRKITRAATRISLGLQNKLTLGNLEASRDWGFAGDYVEAMWMMLQHEISDDWVIATGKTYTVNEFLEKVF
jgi:GDPmannose 4,6-dehydratase